MRKRVGIVGTLGAIALSAGVMSIPTSSAVSQDLASLCSIILATDSVGAFNATPEAIAALNDPSNPCNSLAAEQFSRLRQLSGPTLTDAPVPSLIDSKTGSEEGYTLL